MRKTFSDRLADLCHAAAQEGAAVILRPHVIFDGSVEFHGHVDGKQGVAMDARLRWSRTGRPVFTALDRTAAIGSGLYGEKPATSLQVKEGEMEDWTQIECECGMWLNGRILDNFVRCHECGKGYALPVAGHEVFPVKVVDPAGMPKPTTPC